MDVLIDFPSYSEWNPSMRIAKVAADNRHEVTTGLGPRIGEVAATGVSHPG
jgi:hypothetical protein